VLYRGQIDINRTAGGLTAVNRVDLEYYLKGVLPREVNRFWPIAMIEAQAIVSRSFAVYEALRRKNKDYDLTDDTFSQVYGGRSSERWRTTRAVEATKGKVLEYKGKVLPAYFHSCCGGRTQNVSRAWGTSPALVDARGRSGPLKGAKCSWCRWTPYFRWQARVEKQDILKGLKDEGYYLNRIDAITEGPRDVSGRLKYVRIRSRNKWIEVATEDFRSAIGRRILRSANFKIRKRRRYYIFNGYGWGHGVGMCQWGAFGLSLKKWSAERILARYYPGAKIVDMK
jgi:stage II sporulation protein D